jgi:uncharacterized CHY-type Zn-finger protein
MMAEAPPEIRGIDLDAETRCAHYRGPTDIVAIKMKCCEAYFACKDCHAALADHAIQVWPHAEWKQKAVWCGACRHELTIREYLDGGSRCAACGAQFNPKCSNHYHFYFETPECPPGRGPVA